MKLSTFSDAMCRVMLANNPGGEYPDCITGTTTYTTSTTGGQALTFEDPKTTRLDPTIPDLKIVTDPLTTPTLTWTTTRPHTTPEPTQPKTTSLKPTLPKTTTSPITQKFPNPTPSPNTPEPILAVKDHHDQDHESAIQWIKDLPWYLDLPIVTTELSLIFR